MEMLTLIITLSAVMWYLIDRFKVLWAGLSWGKFITMGLAAVGGFGLAFGFELDMLFAAGLVPEVSVLGTILTALALMSGSSAVSEIVGKVKGE